MMINEDIFADKKKMLVKKYQTYEKAKEDGIDS